MRHHAHSSAPIGQHVKQRPDSETLKRLFPYLWQYKWRVIAALTFMVGAKLANVGVPLLLKELIDAMSFKPNDPMAVIVVPVSLLLVYGVLRLSVSAFTELRELVFAKATQGAARQIALETFQHLHGLSLRFHLERQTGGMTRDIERGVRGIESLISFSLYSVVPTLIEVALVLSILAVKFDVWFAGITLAALALYIVFTIQVTEWRTHFRRQANEFDSAAHTKAVDSLLNYETVKYFNNEAFEAARYDKSLEALRLARLKSQTSLSLLNTGQQLIIAVALVGMLWRATQGVVDGRMTLGDLVMINAFMIQLYIPLNFLGVLYREIKQSLTDLDRMFTLLEKEREVADAPRAPALQLSGSPTVKFDSVVFAYEATRPILHGISFEIPAGKTVAVVGPSGSGKSTLARLLFRFYDVGGGAITIDGQDIRQVTQGSVRRAMGIVPQDTVLFNDTVRYNIAYGRTDATEAEVEQAAKAAHIHDFISATPKGYDTMVGERGLKLSGGEKQRVAIARTLLKNPPIVIFDEATSALDSANERAIQAELQSAAQNKTTLVIAHRLSTVVDAHEILVLDAGRIVEQGAHSELLALNGRYAQMWALQQSSEG
ncbi:MAG: metal ABC transporter permease [Burkholderiales bacterium 35-55-47]|jgi:ATP-binding cassette subfamily B protein|uniref:ABCB family ABC transporter ATP-binding protein/permease n=1 Tax=Limnohabitans sp. TaxID=1907725 RepID=UPI000BD43771|nr:ABC transporter ATP-binding protein/permease [Limnohabitans sp.]OYY20374.1 MAG: metal ABC transporter permease [Burkholderiales bacterium 35-55-47]OYZ74014.1 MAG: metal ABC transporter permease [Burkholderiales bacterium 24-55-52]OZB02094.1 MAG: metal ABC transporter permease [Burkholderiales bacterium 39-55-53]HQR86644.1 ABC transporter ATP-binding protein/permease [Limnohabitans sp.]HQS27939.1 ABC transporter ATP-binding protein/permease [Limnohabitans sp.]